MSLEPEIQPQPARQNDPNALPPNGAGAVQKGNVLLLDDDKFLVDMYCMKFTKAGYTIEACLGVDDALQVLKNGFQADAIVFDIVMPEHDGFYFLETLKNEKLGGRAALIALTNESDEAQKAHAIELGANRVVVKATMIPSEVVSTVAEEIKKKKER
ncbi:MAG: response regulator [bacterium]|nr:response regulator [bacterium]